jgi:sugar lactone lactonase YvrE
MAEPAVKLACDAGAAIGEAPLWQAGRLLWTDPVERRLLGFADNILTSEPVARSVWSLAGLADGMVAGTLDDAFCTIDAAGAIRPGLTAQLDPGCRLNDMAVDAHGGLWAGVMHRGLLATRGAIVHAPSLGEMPRIVAFGLGVPNGMKFSADGSTLYVVDTLARVLLAYPAEKGMLGEPVVVSDFLGLAGKPDGMVIDSEGSFWVAMWGGACVVQLAPDGAFLRQIAIPAPHVSSLCFLGPDRLLVTTSRMRLSPLVLAEHPGSGAVFEIRL